ncbi:MAG: hypothetical protein ACLP7P_09555 [Rhodomicrobium sp.]
MERLPHDPRNLRELVEADLRRAARLIVKVQDEIDPQFLALCMAWKQALGFTLASELYEPDSVYCVGFMPKERHACLARIRREPKPWTAMNFGEVEWLPDSSIDPTLFDLLPRGAREMTARDLATLEKWFGSRGKFPAVKVNTGELGI